MKHGLNLDTILVFELKLYFDNIHDEFYIKK